MTMSNRDAASQQDSEHSRRISVVVPVKDEQDTLARLAEGIFEAARESGVKGAEIVFVWPDPIGWSGFSFNA